MNIRLKLKDIHNNHYLNEEINFAIKHQSTEFLNI